MLRNLNPTFFILALFDCAWDCILLLLYLSLGHDQSLLFFTQATRLILYHVASLELVNPTVDYYTLSAFVSVLYCLSQGFYPSLILRLGEMGKEAHRFLRVNWSFLLTSKIEGFLLREAFRILFRTKDWIILPIVRIICVAGLEVDLRGIATLLRR